MTCPRCAHAIAEGLLYCHACGLRLADVPARASAPSAAPQPAPPTAVPQPAPPTGVQQPAPPPPSWLSSPGRSPAPTGWAPPAPPPAPAWGAPAAPGRDQVLFEARASASTGDVIQDTLLPNFGMVRIVGDTLSYTPTGLLVYAKPHSFSLTEVVAVHDYQMLGRAVGATVTVRSGITYRYTFGAGQDGTRERFLSLVGAALGRG